MMEQQDRADRIRRQNMSACMRTAREFMREEDAVGVVEIILTGGIDQSGNHF